MTNEKRNMTIIGGTRGLGRWIAEHLKNDFNITITSRDKSSGQEVASQIGVKYNNNNIESIKDAHVILFCVPIEYMAKTIKEVAPHAPSGSLLMDVASIKTEAAEALKEYAPSYVEILPSHPMCGPRVPNLKRQIVVLTPIEERSTTWLPRINDYLTKKDCEVVITTPHEHDKYMSIVQGLTHFSFISLASAIKKLNINVEKSRTFSSPVYSIMLDMVSRVVFQNPNLYYSIQKNNKETRHARETLIKECIYLSNLIEKEDEEDFVNNIIESARHINESEDALERSDEAITMINYKANYLKKMVGTEIGFKHHVTNNVYVGIIQNVTSDNVILKDFDGKEIKLKMYNIDVLSDEEIFDWKKNNLKLEYFDLSVLFPSKCNEKYLLKLFNKIEPVIDVEIIDISRKKDVNESLTCFTFHYSLFDKKDKSYVEKYIEGIGGIVI